MKVERTQDYPIAAEQLVRILTDKEFFVARFAMSNIDNYHFDSFDMQGDELVIRVRREVSLRPGNVPVFARKFIGNSYQMVQEFIWTETKTQPFHARYRFSVGNAPVAVAGAITIRDVNGKAQQHVVVDVSSNVPLVGNKIAALVAEKVDSGLDSDYRGTMRYLQQAGLAG